MTDREHADPTSVLCRQLLEREARLERLLVQLLEHDRPRARSARRAYTVLTTRLGEQIRLTERQVQILRLLVDGAHQPADRRSAPGPPRHRSEPPHPDLPQARRGDADPGGSPRRRPWTGQRRSSMSMGPGMSRCGYRDLRRRPAQAQYAAMATPTINTTARTRTPSWSWPSVVTTRRPPAASAATTAPRSTWAAAAPGTGREDVGRKESCGLGGGGRVPWQATIR